MAYNRVRAGSLYRYEPVPLDRFHPPYNIEVHYSNAALAMAAVLSGIGGK